MSTFVFTHSPLEFYQGIPLYFSKQNTQTESTVNIASFPMSDSVIDPTNVTLTVKAEDTEGVEQQIRGFLSNNDISALQVNKNMQDKWEITIDKENLDNLDENAETLKQSISKQLGVPSDKISILYVVRN
jgi:hypothetical protein